MKDAIAFVLGNFTLTFFVLGLVASAIALWYARPPRSAAVIVEALFSYFLLFSIGLASFYNFVLHVVLRRGGGQLHRMGGQPLPARGGLCQPRHGRAGVPGLQGQLRHAARGH